MNNSFLTQASAGVASGLIIASLTSLLPKDWLTLIGSYIPLKLIAPILFGLIISIFILIYINLKLKNKLTDKKRTAFGILWDNNLQAYCPKCNLPMADYDSYGKYAMSDEKVFLCAHCKTQHRLMDQSGIVRSLTEAQEQLKGSSI